MNSHMYKLYVQFEKSTEKGSFFQMDMHVYLAANSPPLSVCVIGLDWLVATRHTICHTADVQRSISFIITENQQN